MIFDRTTCYVRISRVSRGEIAFIFTFDILRLCLFAAFMFFDRAMCYVRTSRVVEVRERSIFALHFPSSCFFTQSQF